MSATNNFNNIGNGPAFHVVANGAPAVEMGNGPAFHVVANGAPAVEMGNGLAFRVVSNGAPVMLLANGAVGGSVIDITGTCEVNLPLDGYANKMIPGIASVGTIVLLDNVTFNGNVVMSICVVGFGRVTFNGNVTIDHIVNNTDENTVITIGPQGSGHLLGMVVLPMHEYIVRAHTSDVIEMCGSGSRTKVAIRKVDTETTSSAVDLCDEVLSVDLDVVAPLVEAGSSEPIAPSVNVVEEVQEQPELDLVLDLSELLGTNSVSES